MFVNDSPSMQTGDPQDSLAHPRTMGWFGSASLGVAGSNLSLFLIGALVLSQGSAAVPLLIAGLVLSIAAVPGWLELVLMSPNRVGGIAASCSEAFRPYSPLLSNLTGVCYWWGWVPVCSTSAFLLGTTINAVPSCRVCPSRSSAPYWCCSARRSACAACPGSRGWPCLWR